VQKIVVEHNHYLASRNKIHKLRSQREIIEADRKLIGQARRSGMKPSQVFNFMKEHYGGEDKVPFTKMDCYNEIGRERRQYLEGNDAQTLSEYLRNKQAQDPTFFYAVEVDKDTGHIANFFWADDQSIMDYKYFGDAVSFDTTFQTNKLEMPFAPILGTNHHKQTIIFGCALMFNETIPSFVCLLSPFFKQCLESTQAQFSQIKMRQWQQQLLMYSQTQPTAYVCGILAKMLSNILVL